MGGDKEGEGGRGHQAALGRACPVRESTSAVFTERLPVRARATGGGLPHVLLRCLPAWRGVRILHCR